MGGGSAESPFFLQMCVLIGNVTQYLALGVVQLFLGTHNFPFKMAAYAHAYIASHLI